MSLCKPTKSRTQPNIWSYDFHFSHLLLQYILFCLYSQYVFFFIFSLLNKR
nr:MAG TPA: hypothetical protein [Caudoviricetes sp.]